MNTGIATVSCKPCSKCGSKIIQGVTGANSNTKSIEYGIQCFHSIGFGRKCTNQTKLYPTPEEAFAEWQENN